MTETVKLKAKKDFIHPQIVGAVEKFGHVGYVEKDEAFEIETTIGRDLVNNDLAEPADAAAEEAMAPATETKARRKAIASTDTAVPPV